MQDTVIQNKRPITVIGHRNPDTDSICSAIGYAYLMRELTKEHYEAKRAGALNRETAYVLKRFGVKQPPLCTDLSPVVADLLIHKYEGISPDTSIRKAWDLMKQHAAHTLPVLCGASRFEALITVKDIAVASMDNLDATALAKAKTPVINVLETLSGTLLVGDSSAVISDGKLCIGAGSYEAMKEKIAPKDTVLVANRRESQLTAIELGAACLVICLSKNADDEIIAAAKKSGCLLICTEHDTYTAARLINQSIPVSGLMLKDPMSFSPTTTVDDARAVMKRTSHSSFPIINKDGEYRGMINKSDIVECRRRKVVLVDHNEKSQSVEGIEEADIISIIDHHKLGDLQTSEPVLVRNQPVGCTATIIWQMFCENSVSVPANLAGILCSAILSDTLGMRSPTCTEADRIAAAALCRIAGCSLERLAEDMFEAGESLDGSTAETLIHQDYKIFVHNDMRFAVAQGSYFSKSNLNRAQEMIKGSIDEIREKSGVDLLYYIATSIQDNYSDVICAGKNAEKLAELAFGATSCGSSLCVPGLMSRKKQFIPPLLQAMQRFPELLDSK